MPDNRRRFALRENGEETSVFKGHAPRQAALKAARRLDPAENEEEAMKSSEEIHLREHGTIDTHIYDAWAWEEITPDDGPEWLGETVIRANVRKENKETTTRSESDFDYGHLYSLLIDGIVSVTEDKCKKCGESLGKSCSTTVVEEIPPPIEPIQYLRYNYQCDSCGTKNRGTNTSCPSSSAFGVNVLAQTVLLYYEYRLPCRKVAQLFKDFHRYDISPASVVHACDYLYPTARREYEKICYEIKSSNVVYIDETSFCVDGDNYWLWGFTTGNKTLYALRECRGSAVLEEVLGDSFNGVIVCDGWTGYSAYHAYLQRCWAHLLREKDNLSKENTEALSLYEKLQELHEELNEFLNTNPPLMQRVFVQQEAQKIVEDLISDGAESEKALDLLQTLHGGLGHWFTFVVHPNVDSTNNQAERVLRDSVIRRKTMTLRAQKGVNSYETYQSLIRTWKQQGRNPYAELRRLARQIGEHHTTAQDAWD